MSKKSYLTYPRGYDDLPEDALNGCGPAGWKFDLVPDTIWGLCVTEACNIHDAMYYTGLDEKDRTHADNTFLNNLNRIITHESRFKFLARFRRRRAWLMFAAVRKFGGNHFSDYGS